MTAIEIKTEIQKALNEVPDEALTEILLFIKNFQSQTNRNFKSDENFEKIMNKHSELLQKLAQ